MSKTCNEVKIGLEGACIQHVEATCLCLDCSENEDCILCPEHGCPKYPLIPEPEKWSYNFSEDGLWDNEVFETGEEAYEAGKDAALEDGYEVFYIGQLVPITIPQNYVMVTDEVLRQVSQYLDDEYGSEFEHGERWYEKITEDEKLTLDEMLNNALQAWLEKTHNHPKTLMVTDIDEYCRTDGTWIKEPQE